MSSSIMNVYVNHNVKDFVPYKRNFSSSLKHAQWVMLLAIAYVLTSRVHGLSSETLQDDAPCSFPLQVNTNAVYFYQFLEIPMHIKLSSRIVFEVKSSKDVHIALAPTTNSTTLYEIVIGAGSNTFSTIRRCKLCADLVYRGTAFYLNSDEYRRFWITFGNNGSITVGKDEASSPFLEWTDPNPLEINYLGYSTGWKSKGEFRFCNFGVNSTLTPPTESVTELWSQANVTEEGTIAVSEETATKNDTTERPLNFPDTKHTVKKRYICYVSFILGSYIKKQLLVNTRGNRPTRKLTDVADQHQFEKLSPPNKEESTTNPEIAEAMEVSTESDLAYTNVSKRKEDFNAPSYVSYAKVIRHPEDKNETGTDGRIYNVAYESYNIER
ncbi:C3 and PZP-like alpha-2-macroglobulin domain-containing protein 8 [Holothuria leucospilota]|uniref:C3 and PZP-like alpha-2-macroglobulin domain-containing protein 8 n=1 Tax=Holothuria leucospilota TaxID=206669 RepID=A0A9Q1CPF3_HOLLE|nr:C3 and PZP-like alpha-2-macroglobulin domain-containing protein 8 [Holothuria leucospilota]